MMRIPLSMLGLLGLAATLGSSAIEPCCGVISLDAKRQTVTAIHRQSAKLFAFTVKSPKVFRSISVGDRFEAPIEQSPKGKPLAADVGAADPLEPCCNVTAALGEAGQALGVHPHDQTGVDVILTELKRTAGNTVTARWQYLNGSDKALPFEQKGCVGMGCTYTLAEGVHFLDGATRTKHEVLRDTENKAVAQRYEAASLAVGPHQLLGTWAKFNAPPASSSTVTVSIPGVSEPFEDVPIAP